MASEYRRKLGAALLGSVLLGLCCLTGVRAEEQRSPMPDWSGWWVLDKPFIDELVQAPPPMKPEDLARLRAARHDDTDPDPARYCRPPQFVGFSGGFVEAVELLVTPGRVTLTNESGLIRRIYTDGRSIPASHEDTNTGTSVGHWDGNALVVETVGINPAARFPLPTQGAMPIGRHAKITERIWLKDPNTLQFEVVTTAPELFVRPDKRKRTYTRVPHKTTASEITFCVDHDRSIDPATGKQRFDMTPPPDLAPPPAN
ncbi:MAG: hypothetical protein ACJ8R9_15495 [Steroidobacteraceae bacterium]